jgi:hypothetical protein
MRLSVATLRRRGLQGPGGRPKPNAIGATVSLPCQQLAQPLAGQPTLIAHSHAIALGVDAVTLDVVMLVMLDACRAYQYDY